MSSMTFLINDSSTGGNTPVVKILITENADGTVTFVVTQQAGYVGDLRGLFFDVADETLIGSLSATASASLTSFQQGNDTVKDLGNGANMQGLLGDDGGYDLGVEIGSSGLKTSDDVRSFSFTLDSSRRDLTLADFSNVSFGARITSVGLDSNLDGVFESSRSGSSKTGEVTFAVITPTTDAATVIEDAAGSGNVLANDGAGVEDVLTVTGWSGGPLGTEYDCVELNHAKIKLDANGSYTIDASAADALGAGESVSHTFTYDVLQTNVDGTSTHTVSFMVTITGTNDAPVLAVVDVPGAVTEAGSNADTGALSTSSSFGFDDLDLSDTHTVGFTPVGSTLGTLSALSITDPATGLGDGTVSWTYSVNAADVAYLAEGETRVESFTVSVTDVQGLADSATVQVTITGTNDAPVLAVVDVPGAVTEAGSNADTGALSTSSSFGFDDLDLSDTHTVGFTPVGSTLGTLSALSITDPATGLGDGTVSWTYSVNAADVAYLAEGETRVESFTVSVTDVQGLADSATVQVTITGTNDAPVLAVVDVPGAVTEAGSNADTGALSTSSSFGFDDLDLSDTHTVGFTPVGSTLGTLSALSITDPATGLGDGTVSWTYSVNAADVAYLAEGETRVESFTVSVTDVQGLADSATVQVTITGTNDAPVLAVVDVPGAVTEAGSNADTGALSTSSSFGFDDLDLSDTHTVDFTPVGSTLGTLSALSITDPATGLGDGTVSWTYSVNAADVAYLAEGETRVESFTVSVTDVQGLADSATVQVTITGTNDAPVLAVADVPGAVTEAGSNADTGALSTSSSFGFDDLDLSDTHTVDFTPVGSTLGTLSALSITDPATGLGDGTVSWTYSVNAADVAYLAEGETRVESFTVSVTDVQGLADSATVQVTITGTNDAPVLAVVDVTGAVTELGTPAGNLTDSGTIAFSDADLEDAHSLGPVTASAGALGTLTAAVTTPANDLDGTGGAITWSYAVAASAVEYLAQDEIRVDHFTFTLSDGHGGTIDRTVDVTITGTNDAPDLHLVTTDSAAATLQETNAGLSAGATLTVTDVDTTDVIGSIVSGVVASGTTAGLGLTDAQLLAMMGVAPTAGLAANSGDTHNLAWTFNSGTQAFDYLDAGQSLFLDYTIASSDGHGGSDPQHVIVTINGAADGPTDIVLTGFQPSQTNISTGTIGQLSAVGASGAVTFGATLVEKDLAGATQADSTADITVSSAGAVTGVSGPNGIQEGRIYELNVTAIDSGGSLTELFRVVTGTTGTDTINLSSTNEDLVFLASGNDSIFSGGGHDTVYGQSGTDLIHGGDGNDVLYGMNGTDTFFFDAPLNAAMNVDTIEDFNANNGNPNSDTLYLSTSVFAGIGSGTGTLAAADFASVSSGGSGDVSGLSVGAAVNIVFDSSTGGLYYDANGGSLADGTKFAVIDPAGSSGTFDNGDIKFGA